jgi:hypothetical protein
MGNFFDEITDFLGFTNTDAEQAAQSGNLRLGDVFLGGGLATRPTGATPFTNPFAGFSTTPFLSGGGATTNPFNFQPATNSTFPGQNTLFRNFTGTPGTFGQQGLQKFQQSFQQPGSFMGGEVPGGSFFGGGGGGVDPNNPQGLVQVQLPDGSTAFTSPAQAQQGGFNITGGGQGGGFRVNGSVVGASNRAPENNLFASLGQFQPVQDRLLQQARTEGADPRTEAALNQSFFSNLNIDPFAIAQDQLQRSRSLARPEEDRLIQATRTDLQRRGRRGADDSATGRAFEGLSQGLQSADLQRQQQALGFGFDQFNQGFGRAMQAGTLRDQLRTQGLQRQLLASSGAQDLSRLSTLPLELQLQTGIARSNALLDIGSTLSGISGNTTSPAGLFGDFLSMS